MCRNPPLTHRGAEHGAHIVHAPCAPRCIDCIGRITEHLPRHSAPLNCQRIEIELGRGCRHNDHFRCRLVTSIFWARQASLAEHGLAGLACTRRSRVPTVMPQLTYRPARSRRCWRVRSTGISRAVQSIIGTCPRCAARALASVQNHVVEMVGHLCRQIWGNMASRSTCSVRCSGVWLAGGSRWTAGWCR